VSAGGKNSFKFPNITRHLMTEEVKTKGRKEQD
jgi:hypothetical protein